MTILDHEILTPIVKLGKEYYCTSKNVFWAIFAAPVLKWNRTVNEIAAYLQSLSAAIFAHISVRFHLETGEPHNM